MSELDLTRTNIRDLSPLAGYRNLKELRLYETPVQDLSPLGQLPDPFHRFSYLNIYGTEVKDLTPLRKLGPALDRLQIFIGDCNSDYCCGTK